VHRYNRNMNQNEKNIPDDHCMSPDEVHYTNACIDIEQSQEIIRTAIAFERSKGQLSDEAIDRERILNQKLIDLERQKKFLLMLERITDLKEREAVEMRFYKEGYPPEIFVTDENFIVDGPDALQ